MIAPAPSGVVCYDIDDLSFGGRSWVRLISLSPRDLGKTKRRYTCTGSSLLFERNG